MSTQNSKKYTLHVEKKGQMYHYTIKDQDGNITGKRKSGAGHYVAATFDGNKFFGSLYLAQKSKDTRPLAFLEKNS